jgi:hypothetical protein
MNFTKRPKYEITNLQLDEELKNLAVKIIRTGENVDNVGHLSKLKTYEFYHQQLAVYFKTKCHRKPTQTDNLAFMLLLSYPERMILQFTSFKDLKLSFNNCKEESDFDSIGFEIGTDEEENTCICNEPIKNIHIFRNKFSGMSFQIGSICNERYGLISKQDPNYKSTCKKIKEHKEKEKERSENLPEGYYENDRKQKKLLREQNKQIKEEEEIIKKELKQMREEERKTRQYEINFQKQLKEMNKSGRGHYVSKKCYLCKRDGIYKFIDKLYICSNCEPNEHKNLKRLINSGIKNALKECVNCDLKLINNGNDLCQRCNKEVKIKGCNLCNERFIIGINKNDLYCDVCDENLINCLDCRRELLKQQSQNLRCYKCNYKYINKIEVKVCEYCDDEFEIGEKEKWKTCCSECYVDNRILQKCDLCNDYFKKMKNETWKKVCKTCYYKNKNLS